MPSRKVTSDSRKIRNRRTTIVRSREKGRNSTTFLYGGKGSVTVNDVPRNIHICNKTCE